MSVTTFGDLLTEAEQVLIVLARQREPNAPGLAAGWPAFSRRAVHAITAATGARDPRWYAVDRLIIEVARPMGGAVVASAGSGAAADPLLERAGSLLGAAGDVLASAPRDTVADPMLLDANVKAAQSRVTALLAAAAHTSVRALGRHGGCTVLAREDARDIAETLMRNERLATVVFQSSPTLESRAHDVAVVSIHPSRISLEEAVEVWGRHARDTVRSPSPSARDLQAVGADLSRIATHSRVLVAAAVSQNVVDPARGLAVDAALGRLGAGWLDVAQAWTGLHTAQPPTPAKIAASHALGQALMAVTRDGRDWASPAVVTERIDVARALGALRRALDVGRDVAEAEPLLATQLAGLLYAPAALTAPSLERLHARVRGELVTVGSVRHRATDASREHPTETSSRSNRPCWPSLPGPRSSTPCRRVVDHSAVLKAVSGVTSEPSGWRLRTMKDLDHDSAIEDRSTKRPAAVDTPPFGSVSKC